MITEKAILDQLTKRVTETVSVLIQETLSGVIQREISNRNFRIGEQNISKRQ